MEVQAQLILNIFYTSMLYFLVALSFSVIYHTIKLLNISHAVVITIAPYLYFSINVFFLNSGLALLLSISLAILINIFIYHTIFFKLIKKGTENWMILISSLGVYIIFQNLISLVWGDTINRIRIGAVKPGNELFGAYVTDIQIITISLSACFLVLALLFYRFTKLGRQMRAVSSNQELANIFGIDSNKVILWAFGIGSGLAAIAGILVAFEMDMRPTMGFNLLLYGVIAMIIGGVGSTWGLVGGAFLLATAQHLGAYYIDSKWMEAIAYIILILFLIWRPLGFSGKKLKKTEI